MRKYISKIAVVFLMTFIIGIGYGVSAKAADDGGVVGTTNLNGTTENSAKVGDTLKEPEKGWKRYDDTNKNIRYEGKWEEFPFTLLYNGSEKVSTTASSKVIFNFYGDKLRIMGQAGGVYSDNIKISIDSHEEIFFQKDIKVKNNTLNYEKLGLNYGKHRVKIELQDNKEFNFDSIDIDYNGNLLSQDYTTLAATADNKKQNITLNWDRVDGAEKYIIKKSTTQEKEEKIQEVKENTYMDSDVQAGKTYYYIVVPVINGKEGTPSNEASAIIEKSTEPSKPDTKGDAVLTITMTNGNIKSYNVSMEKVNDFIKWYENRSNGSNGTPFYKFDKSRNEDKIITEYIVFDKISSFQVEQNK